MTGLIVQEWIERRGGAENVLENIAATFPDAEIGCLWNDAPGRFGDVAVRESVLARTPLRGRKAAALPLMSRTWRRFDTREAEWVIASSHVFAHHVGPKRLRTERRVAAYVHTPARYVWDPDVDGRGKVPGASVARAWLRRIDRKAAGDGIPLAANSRFVQQRIERVWGRESTVIHPPVRVSHLRSVPRWADTLDAADAAVLESLPTPFVLGASRFVPYKQLDQAIRVGELIDVPVVLAGGGPDEPRLRSAAAASHATVTFVPDPSDTLLFSLMQEAAMFVFAAVEDFGIMPVEAMTLGTPALVGPEGGARESVELIGHGSVVDFRSDSELTAAASAAMAPGAPPADAIEAFSETMFRRNVRAWLPEFG